MRAKRHIEESDDHGIDLAPMLDFVMNLLIFFIITAVFVKEMGVTVNRAGGASGGGGGNSAITVSITETHTTRSVPIVPASSGHVVHVPTAARLAPMTAPIATTVVARRDTTHTTCRADAPTARRTAMSPRRSST